MRRVELALALGLMLAGVPATPSQQSTSRPGASDWPMWGGSPSRNAFSSATGVPHEWDVKSGRNIKWVARLGTYTYGGPVVAGGKVLVGTNNGAEYRPKITGDKGCVLCFDQRTGALLWQASHDKLASGPANDWPEQGVASTPCVDGDRVYYVSNRCELVCADLDGFHDGENDGPLRDEKYTELQDADFVWILDMIGELGVYPHNLAACSPVAAGDLVFVCTGNGVDEEHDKPPAPAAPSFVAVDKKTGKVVWKRSDPGDRILHGQWSSPAYGVVKGQPQVIFGGGDGWCYAFEPNKGQLLWKFDLNSKDAAWKRGGGGSRNSIVASPVICSERVFLAVGDDPEQGTGPGRLCAIDAGQTGDVTDSGGIWQVGGKDFGKTIASVAVADGLVYAVDLDGFLSCFDADSGRRHWRHDTQAAVWGSPLVADGKVYLGTADGDVVVLRHAREPVELARNRMGAAVYTTPAVADGTLYIATQKTLYAIAAPATAAPSTTSAPAPPCWPMFRGNRELTGVAAGPLPEKLELRWKYELGGGTSSTAAIVAGVVYLGADDRQLYALDLANGHVKWTYQAADAVESAPAVIDGLVVFGDNSGILHACDARSGAARWNFKTGDRIVCSVNWRDQRLVFGSYDRHVYCLQAADGSLVWKYEVPERVHGTAGIHGDYVLIGCCDAHLHVIRFSDGSAVRRVALRGVTGSAAASSGNRVFLPTYGQQVLGINWETGEVLWRFEDPQHAAPFVSSAAVVGERVIVGGRDRRLRALDADSGRPRWEFAAKGKIDSSPVVVGDRVFVGADDGNLYAVDLDSGKELWRFEAGGAISASPAVGEGCLVIGTEEGMVYCFGQK